MSDDLVIRLRTNAGIDDVHDAADLIEPQAAEITRLRAALATARREGMEKAAQRLEELHRNHGYNSRTGEVRRRGELVTCPLTIEHAMAYYRAIAEGVAHILRAAAKEGES